MKIYAIFPDESFMKNMSIHTMETPSKELTNLGVICCPQGEFFSSYYKEIKNDDIVIMWIGSRNEEWLDLMTKLNCRKFLRNIDSCKSDRILFKREQEIFHRVGFEAILVTYCTEYNRKFLLERGIKNIDYPHLIDFSSLKNIDAADKKYDILISGQISEKSYPTRTKIAKAVMNNKRFMETHKVIFIPHPGYSKSHTSHNFYGENYIDLASQCRLSVVCTGDDDSLVLKYLEFANAGTLPAGDYPSNMPEASKEAMLFIDKNMEDSEILSKIEECLLNKKALQDKIEKYRNPILKFDVKFTKNVLEKIIKADYESSF